jgi:hypothetical protein
MSGRLARHYWLSLQHAAAWFSVRQVVVALIFVGAFIVLLAGPVVGEAILNVLSHGMEKAAPGGFLLGLGILLVGLLSGVQVILIAGGCLTGAVVLGVILNNYLSPPGRTSARSSAPVSRPGRPLPSEECDQTAAGQDHPSWPGAVLPACRALRESRRAGAGTGRGAATGRGAGCRANAVGQASYGHRRRSLPAIRYPEHVHISHVLISNYPSLDRFATRELVKCALPREKDGLPESPRPTVTQRRRLW